MSASQAKSITPTIRKTEQIQIIWRERTSEWAADRANLRKRRRIPEDGRAVGVSCVGVVVAFLSAKLFLGGVGLTVGEFIVAFKCESSRCFSPSNLQRLTLDRSVLEGRTLDFLKGLWSFGPEEIFSEKFSGLLSLKPIVLRPAAGDRTCKR